MAYVAIETKFLPATNHRESRIRATMMDPSLAEDGRRRSVTLPYRHDINSDQNHYQAAQALLPSVARDIIGLRLHVGETSRGYVWTISRNGVSSFFDG